MVDKVLSLKWRFWLLLAVILLYVVAIGFSIADPGVPLLDDDYAYLYMVVLVILYFLSLGMTSYFLGCKLGLVDAAILGWLTIIQTAINPFFREYIVVTVLLTAIGVFICWLCLYTGQMRAQIRAASDVIRQQAEKLSSAFTGRRHVESELQASEEQLRVALRILEDLRTAQPVSGTGETYETAISQSTVALKKALSSFESAETAEGPAAGHITPDTSIVTLSVSPLRKPLLVELYAELVEQLQGVLSCSLASYRLETATYRVYGVTLDQLSKSILVISYPAASSIRVVDNTLAVRLEEIPADIAPDSFTGAVKYTKNAGDRDYELGVDLFFNASHNVQTNGKPGPTHPHSWRVQARFSGDTTDKNGILVGFAEAKEIVQKRVSHFNGKLLNDITPFDELQPTSENLAKILYNDIKNKLDLLPLRLHSISIWESPTNFVTYSENEQSVSSTQPD